MTETFAQYWPLFLGGLLVVLGLLWLLTRRRQRVEIDDVRPVGATLARTQPADPVVVAPDPVIVPIAIEPGTGDDLRRIKGLGPKVAARLSELGIAQFDQLAALNPEQQAALDAQLGAFAGRMARDRWIEQARLLASDDITAFEAEFGKLG